MFAEHYLAAYRRCVSRCDWLFRMASDLIKDGLYDAADAAIRQAQRFNKAAIYCIGRYTTVPFSPTESARIDAAYFARLNPDGRLVLALSDTEPTALAEPVGGLGKWPLRFQFH